MRKKGRESLIPLDPKTIGDTSEQHINSLLSMGYMPFQTKDGNIRWLTEEQYAYYQVKQAKKPILKYMFTPKYQGMRRRQRSKFRRFLRHNGEVILLILAVVAFFFILYCLPRIVH